MPLHVSSTVVLIIRRSKLYYTASGIVTLSRWPSSAQVGRGLHVSSTVVLIIRRSKLYYTASGIITTCAPDGHLQGVMIPDAV